MTQKRVGELLLEQKLITDQQLNEALGLQKVFPDLTVGQLLCKLGFISETDLGHILDQKGKRRKLADILLKGKSISNEQLAQARQLSKTEAIPLDKALLKLRLVDAEQLAKALSVQFDLPFVHIDTLEIETDLSRFFSASYAQKQKIIPISKIGNTLTVAMAYPLTLQELKELEASIRLRIIPVICMESEIGQAQQRLYRNLGTHLPASDEFAFDMEPDSIGELLSKSQQLDEPEVDEEVRKVTEKDSVIVKLVNKVIYDAYRSKASDIHIEPYPGKSDVIVRMRIDGRCKIYQRIPYKYKYAITSRLKIMAELDIAERRRPQDGKINFKKFAPIDLELRVATMPTAGGLEDVVIRLLNTNETIQFDQLGLTERNKQVFFAAVRQPHGLLLVVGPTGSGKTTTLHSAVARINNPEIKIWTAEDPVEITQKGLRQVQINPRIGFTFAAALRSFLRLDPDVILVGEMRDIETAAIAIEASLTGHLVLSTLHTNSAPESVTRLLEMGLDPFSFSDSLLCIIAQRLARTFCSDCKELYQPEQSELQELIEEFGAEQFALLNLSDQQFTMARPVGCDNCGQSGYRGRIGIHEVLDCTEELKGLIKRKVDTDKLKMQAASDGMTTLKQDGILKVLQGMTDIHEIRRVCIK